MFVPIFFLILYSFFSPSSVAQYGVTPKPNDNAGNCTIDGFTDNEYSVLVQVPQISDNDISKTLKTWSFKDKLDVQTCVMVEGGFDFTKYINITSENETFSVRTNEALVDLDKDIPRQSKTFVSSDIVCTLQCENITIVQFDFMIEDINEHHPTFSKPEFNFSIPSPLMPRTDLSRYGPTIVVEDLDFSNKNVTFTIEPDDFKIETLVEGKEYTAVFYADKIITLTEPKEYILTATDTGIKPGPLSSTAKITLTVDSVDTIDYPTFTKPSYSFKYEENGESPLLKPTDGPVIVKSSKLKDAKINITGDQSDKIEAILNQDTNEIELKLKSKFETSVTLLSFIITIKTDTKSSVLVVVELPEPTVEFEKKLYRGSYDPTKKTLKTDEIKIESSAEPKFLLSGDEAKYLTTKWNDTAKSYSLTFKDASGFPEVDIKGKSSLAITLTATVGHQTDSSVVLISIPSPSTLKFSSILYEAKYDGQKKTVTVDDKNPIAFSNAVEDVTISFDEKYSTYFEIDYNKSTKHCDVKVKTELPPAILESGKSIVFEISALDDQKNVAEAGLEIVIPKITGPEFKKSYYEVSYPEDGKGPIDVPLDFVDSFNGKISVSLEDYKDNFEIATASEEKWQIKIIKPLETAVILKTKELRITLIATETGKTSPSSHSVLIMALPEIKGPEFADTLYETAYPEDGKEILSFSPELKFKTSVEVESIMLSGEYSKNFKVIKDGSNWKINITTPLDLEKLKEHTALALAMIANGKDDVQSEKVTLVIKLPPKNIVGPTFKKTYYNLKYPKDIQKGGKIDFSDLSFNDVTDESKIIISLDTEYQSNFKVERNSKSNKWQLVVQELLDAKTLNDNNQLLITLTVEETGKSTSTKGTTVLVLTLEKDSTEQILKFKSEFYVAKYPKTGAGDIDFDKVIGFSNFDKPESVLIKPESYTGNFELTFNKTLERWQLHIKSPLSKDDLKKSALVVLLEATVDGFKAGTATLVIQIETETVAEPKFKDAFYVADYPESGQGEILLNNLDFENVNDKENVEITIDEYEDYFNCTQDEITTKWIIKIVKPLEKDKISGKSDLPLTMTAKIDSFTAKGALVLNLPHKSIDDGPKFKNEYYTAQYPKTASVNQELDISEAIGFSNIEDATTIDIEIEDNKYKDNFGIIYNSTKTKWVIKIKKPLDNALLKNKQIITSIVATKKADRNTGKAVLVIQLPNTDNTGNDLHFSKSLYTGEYIKAGTSYEVNLSEKIVVKSKTETDKISLLLSSKDIDVDKYFTLSKGSDGYTIKVKEILDNKILDVKKYLTITIQAKLEDDVRDATLILNLPPETNEKLVSFENILYKGQYKDKKLSLEGIKVITDLTDEQLDFAINPDTLAKDFKISYKDKVVTIEVQGTLPTENTVISLVLEAMVNKTVKSSAVIEIEVIGEKKEAIQFKKLIHSGEYYVQTEKLEISETIVLDTDLPDDKIEISITDDLELASHLAYTYKDKSLKITKKDAFPKDKIENRGFVSFTISAKEKGTSESASSVLNIKIEESGNPKTSVKFDKKVYNGHLDLQSGKKNFSIEQIVLTVKPPTNNIELSVSKDYQSYFKAELQEGNVKISLLEAADINALKKLTNIAVELTADVKGETVSTFAVLNIEIVGEKKEAVKFQKLIHTGHYYVQNEKLEISEAIVMDTELSDDKIEISITDDLGLAGHLKYSYVNKILTITKKDAFPKDKIENQGFVSFTISAKEKGTSESASSVLNIKIEESENPKTSVKFDKKIYNGHLDLQSGKNVLSIEQIVLTATPSTENIELSVSKEFRSYFKAELQEGKVKISLLEAADITALKNFTNIAVELTADVKAEAVSTFAVLNVEINGDEDERSNIAFPQILYTGTYSMKDGHPHVEQDNIIVITNEQDKDLSIALNGEGKDYFKAILKDKQITLEAKEIIPSDYVHKYPIVPLTLDVIVTETNYKASAILNMKLDIPEPKPDDDGSDKTPYIIAISLLAVCIVVIVLAGAAFYYYKLRTKDYTEVDEELWRVKFDKTSMARSPDGRKGSALENRRPTGYVFNSPPPEGEANDHNEESISKSEAMDRRKSVIFANKIDKREIDSVLEDDDDKDKKDV